MAEGASFGRFSARLVLLKLFGKMPSTRACWLWKSWYHIERGKRRNGRYSMYKHTERLTARFNRRCVISLTPELVRSDPTTTYFSFRFDLIRLIFFSSPLWLSHRFLFLVEFFYRFFFCLSRFARSLWDLTRPARVHIVRKANGCFMANYKSIWSIVYDLVYLI